MQKTHLPLCQHVSPSKHSLNHPLHQHSPHLHPILCSTACTGRIKSLHPYMEMVGPNVTISLKLTDMLLPSQMGCLPMHDRCVCLSHCCWCNAWVSTLCIICMLSPTAVVHTLSVLLLPHSTCTISSAAAVTNSQVRSEHLQTYKYFYHDCRHDHGAMPFNFESLISLLVTQDASIDFRSSLPDMEDSRRQV